MTCCGESFPWAIRRDSGSLSENVCAKWGIVNPALSMRMPPVGLCSMKDAIEGLRM